MYSTALCSTSTVATWHNPGIQRPVPQKNPRAPNRAPLPVRGGAKPPRRGFDRAPISCLGVKEGALREKLCTCARPQSTVAGWRWLAPLHFTAARSYGLSGVMGDGLKPRKASLWCGDFRGLVRGVAAQNRPWPPPMDPKNGYAPAMMCFLSSDSIWAALKCTISPGI